MVIKQLKLFLDLEDTIITNWQEGTLINMAAIREWIGKMFETDEVEVRIFSFAIWSDEDKARFENEMKEPIERALNVEIKEWLSILEMQAIVQEWLGLRYLDKVDFMSLNGKHGAFEKVCLARERNCECVLIDDAVPHRTIHDHTRNLTIELLPIQIVTDRELQEFQHKM